MSPERTFSLALHSLPFFSYVEVVFIYGKLSPEAGGGLLAQP